MSITRRLFLRSVPPSLAVGTVVGAPAIADAKEELPVTHVHRVAKELSKAMDAWMEDLAIPGVPPIITKATVYPASYLEYPVIFEDIEAREPEKSRHEQAIWHMRELERLTVEDGARSACVLIVGHHYQDEKTKMVLIGHNGELDEKHAKGMFREGALS